MKNLVSILLFLFVLTCHAAENDDPALVPLTFGKEPVADTSVVAANVQYELIKALEVKRLAEREGFFFHDVEPVRKGVRLGQAVTGMMDRREFETLLSRSGIFLAVTTPTKYDPGFFYVYVKPHEGRRAAHYFQSANIHAEEWRHKWLVQPHPETILFQCQVDVGDELFWITALRRQAFVDSVYLTPNDYFTTTLTLPSNLNANQKKVAFAIMKQYGLFFDGDTYASNEHSWIRVPTGKETYFIELFKQHGIAMKIVGMFDSNAVNVVELKSQDLVRSDTVTTSLSQSEIMFRLQKFLKGTFPNWPIVRQSEAGMTFASPAYFGPKVLADVHDSGWERAELKVAVSRLENDRVAFDVELKTWYTPHGSAYNRPADLYRVGESPSTPRELQAEENYAGLVLSQITDYFSGRSGTPGGS